MISPVVHPKFDFQIIDLTRIMQFHFALREGFGGSVVVEHIVFCQPIVLQTVPLGTRLCVNMDNVIPDRNGGAVLSEGSDGWNLTPKNGPRGEVDWPG